MDALKGIIIAIISSLVIATLFAYFFRLPVPMVGYIGPFGEFSSYSGNVIEVLKSVLIAWVFYGAFGGFIIVPLLGAVTGYIVGRKFSASKNKNQYIITGSIIAGFVPVFILAILDFIIGPW